VIYDEVQCGMGRTGKLFAHQWFEDAAPDIMAVAKALGGGFPVGACLATDHAASGMIVGVHGSTFGGNPLAMAVATAAFDEVARPDMLAHVEAVSAEFRERLTELAGRHPDLIAEVRGKGLLIGLKMIPNNREFMAIARDHDLLVAGGGENCVRLLPPLIITSEEIVEAVKRLDAACEDARARLAKAAA
jgi:acetylornithine/N-succinyldiaminopimelate aminotransferase